MAENTPLVVALTSVGIAPRRAEAFERLLDDHPFVGISGQKLGRIFELYAMKQAYLHDLACDLKSIAERQAKEGGLVLYDVSVYGTHAAKLSTPGPR